MIRSLTSLLTLMEGTKGVLEMQVKFIYKQESIQCSEVFVFFIIFWNGDKVFYMN